MPFVKIKTQSLWIASVLLAFGLTCLSVRPAICGEEVEKQPELRSFEVQATAKSTYFFDNGKMKEKEGGDQAVYFVDLPKKTITRTAIFYVPRKKKEEGDLQIIQGLKADSTPYSVVYYKDDFMKGQLIIKAIGQTSSDDGFETLVIGEDFVTSTVSTKGFVTLTYFERTDPEARAYRAKKMPPKPKPQAWDENGMKNDDSAVGWARGSLEKFNKWRHQRVPDDAAY